MPLEDLNRFCSNRGNSRRKRTQRSLLFSSKKALKSARMMRAKKQLSKRNDMGAAELRKSIRFDGPVPRQPDFGGGQNTGVGDEDVLEGDEEKEDSVSEDLPCGSLL